MRPYRYGFIAFILIVSVLPVSLASADVTTGLVSHWKLDDGTGSVALDSAGDNHGMLQDDAAWAEGYLGGAILLDGNGDYIDCGNDATFNITDAVTLAAWVQARGDFSYPDWSGIIMRGGPNIDTFALYFHKGTERLGFKTTGATPDWFATANNAAKAIFDGEWHHTAATYDGKIKIVYLDGASIGSVAATGKIGTSTGRVLLGAGRDTSPPTLYVAGRLDDARIFKRALSAADVKELVPPKLLAYQPSPANGAVGVLMPLFQWKPGDTAVLHKVYLGRSADLGPADLAMPASPATTYYHAAVLEPGTTYYWRVDEVEKDMTTTHTGNVWSFTTQALTAYLPDPADGAVDASPTPDLTWSPGQSAVQHHIYLGSSFEAVSQGAADTDKGVQSVMDANFAPGALESLTTYYWRVDEVLVDTTVQAGPVWSFTTYLPVDDFESYTDEVGQRIFQSWIDGFGYTEPKVVAGNGSGATVGYTEPPFAEQKIVHSGLQAMPMDYDNASAPHHSETQRTFLPVADWTVNGADTLVLYVRGKATNTPGQLYVAIKDTYNHDAFIIHGDPAVVTRTTWVEWRISLASFRNGGMNLARVNRISIGVSNQDNPGAGGAGSLYIDDIRVIRPAPVK